MVVSPRRNGVVDVLDSRNAPDEHGEDPQHETADERHGQRDAQKQARRDGGVEPPPDEASQARVLSNRLTGGARDLFRWSLRHRCRVRVPTRGNVREKPGSERCDQVGEERHGSRCGA